MHEGTFTGGPLDGLTYTIESTQGVLVIAKDSRVAWLYRSNGESLVDPRPYELVLDETTDELTGARPFDEDKAIAAAEAGYDIIAAPGEDPTEEELAEEEVLTDGE